MSIQSIDRAFDVIEYLAARPAGGTLSEIASALRLPVSSVFRITADLAESGYLRKNTRTGTYTIGHRFIDLSRPHIKNLELRTEAHTYLNSLSRLLDTRVSLATRTENQICYIDSVSPSDPKVNQPLIGSRRPLFSTALGKSLVMNLPDEELRTLFTSLDVTPITPQTIVTVEDFIDQETRSRERGWSEDIQEDNPDCCCIAAPVINSVGRTVAAVSASWDFQHFAALDRKQAASAVMETTSSIASMLSPVF